MGFFYKTLLVSCVVYLNISPVYAVETKPLSILRITPEGEDVASTRQIVIEFDRPVVPLGRMERTAAEVGITITPPLKCQWRWLNTSALSCNLDEADAMKPATRYALSLAPMITAEDGGKLDAATQHHFITQRPDVEDSNFKTWHGAGLPVIRVVFQQPVSKSSVEQHLFIKAPPTNARVALKVMPDKDEQALPDYLLMPGEKTWVRTDGETHKSNDKLSTIKGEEARRVWLVEPTQSLPLDTNVSLELEEGLISAEGPEAGANARTIVTFDTFPDFAFAGIHCRDNVGPELLIPADNKDPTKLCNPMQSVALAFTAPVLRSQVKDKAVFTPDLAGGRKDYHPWGEEDRDWSQLYEPHKKGRLYDVWLPVGLKAAQSYTLGLPASAPKPPPTLLEPVYAWMGWTPPASVQPDTKTLVDEFGRSLPASITMRFSTAHRNPNFEMPYHDAVLESGIDSELPLYVNNLDSYTFHYRAVNAAGARENQTYQQNVTNISDVQYGVPMGVRTMLQGQSGAVYGTLDVTPQAPNERRLFAQVTPWQAHLKLGHFSSLVWVTDMATGKPVEGVKLTLYKDAFTTMGVPKDIFATAVTDKDGIGTLPGAAALDADQTLLNEWRDEQPRLFMRLDKDADMGLLPLSNAFSLNMWSLTDDNTWADTRDRYGHMKSWGLTAQGIYHAGDTMQYKIFLRHQDDKTLVPPPAGAYTLQIIDPMGKTVQETKDIKFSAFGALAGEYKIPEKAAVGWYDFKLKADFTDGKTPENEEAQDSSDEDSAGHYTLSPLRVLVSDFTPAPFHVTAEIGGETFHTGDVMKIQSRATLHSGGPYGDAAVRATVTLNRGAFTSDNPIAKVFTFGSGDETASTLQLFQKEAVLNDKGEWNEPFTIPQQPIYYGTLEVESAVQDDRGKSIAAQIQGQYIGVDRFVGLKSPEWFYESKKPVTLQTIVVDEKGAPMSGTPVTVTIEREDISVAKVKDAGNAYTSDITREWKPAGECKNTSGTEGVDCIFTPTVAGTYRATAKIVDSQNRPHETQLMLWVAGDDYVQWSEPDHLAMPIVPEKKDYHVGDTAKFLIKNPYPNAQALVTIERYGIIDHFITTLKGSAPVLEIPVKPDYLPGFYLSVLVVSPRVEAPVPKLGQIDMGKPAFRLGYVTVPVKDPYKEIAVAVKAKKDVYRPRDTIDIDLQAVPRHAPDPAEPVELAVAVLDESVFDLILDGKNAFDPYKGFYDLDPLDMRNYSLLYRLIGRQKFEKKGANPGGDGGVDLDMRNIFKYVAYWNPALKTDAKGKAHITFEAPDNLTGWRVLAVATTPHDRMGLGEGTFKVNRPIEVRPVMPNLVREDDSFTAGFSVMNRTDKARTLEVRIETEGHIKEDLALTKTQSVTLEPYKRTTVTMPLQAALLPIESETPEGKISFKVTASDKTEHDGMVYDLRVLKKRVFDVAATYGTTLESKVEEHIAFPPDIYTDTGDVSVVLSPSVIANLTGAFRYMRDYPYPCWEQLLTRGVMAAHYTSLRNWIPESFTWDNAKDAPKETLERAANYQAPNGGMTYFVPSDDHADPYLSAYTALAFGWLKKDGYYIPVDVESKLHDYLLNFLRQDAAPDFYQDGMTSTVRAIALDALAKAGKITAEDVARYEPHLKNMSLFGKAHFMEAALAFENTKPAAKTAADMIFAMGSETGGKFMFNETLDDGYLRILATPLRDNCAVLSAFLSYKATPEGAALMGDKPFKLVRSITQSRGNRDHWENTQENMFCMNALVDYARVYETVKPKMTVTAALENKAFGKTDFKDFRDVPVTLTRPLQEGDAGTKQTLSLDKQGEGRLYYPARLRYAPRAGWETPVNAGMDIHREYSVKRDGKWVILKAPMTIKRGENVRVDLYLSLPTARNFVVVDDPLPSGLETVNRDLKTASSVDEAQASYDQAGGSFWFKYGDWTEYQASFWSFYHRELREDSARFYADWLGAGNYHLSYMTQAIADGTFAAPPVRAEEMYDPDVYGRGENGALSVKTSE